MKIADVKQLEPVEQFLYWMYERHQIFLKRRAGDPKPWTDDEVMQKFFFTNPYRENDRVTTWLRENVREPLRDDDNVVFATICFRWFNWPPTGELLIQRDLLIDWDVERAVECLKEIREQDQQVFTGAFMISNAGSKLPKYEHVCRHFVQPAWDIREYLVEEIGQPGCTMEYAHKTLMQLPGMGGFMAYEVVADLRYTKFLENAPDKCTWSNPGPGAKRGLNRLMGRDLNVKPTDYQERTRELLEIAQERLSDMPPIEMREIEHSLCEYDKYMRAINGPGKMKRKYPGR